MTTVALPPEVFAELDRIGPQITPDNIEATQRLFAPLHEAVGYRAPRVERDAAYGPDPRHRLDVHFGESGAAARPVLMFVHGGAFVGGDKSEPGLPYYDHLGAWAVRNGYVAVTLTYRLAPEHQWPTGATDIAAAHAWVREHIGAFGGDARKVVLMGHSAGGAHVASYVAGHGGPGAEHLAGAVVLSGLFDPPTAERNPPLEAYYGTDPAGYESRSSLAGLAASDVPVLIAVAELDPPDFHRQAARALEAVAQRPAARPGTVQTLVTVRRHTHLSEICSLGLDDEALAPSLTSFIDDVAGRPA